jgi:hypothetical protein
MAERIYRTLALAALALWMGGTTFYAAVVVPTGTRLLGSVEQGLLTEQVTQQLNAIGLVCVLLLLPAARQSRLRIVSWLILALSLATLFFLHPRIAAYIDHANREVTEYNRFYAWHRAYLLTTAVQWLAGLAMFWGLTSPSVKRPLGPQPYDMREKNMAC